MFPKNGQIHLRVKLGTLKLGFKLTEREQCTLSSELCYSIFLLLQYFFSFTDPT